MNNLNGCIVFEVCLQNKKGYDYCTISCERFSSVNHSTETIHHITSLYRSPSQTHDKIGNFLLNFEQALCDIIARNLFSVLIIGYFSARAAKWWRNDTAPSEGTKMDSITNSYGFSQIISDPTHVLSNSFSCINLILKSQLKLVIESRVHPSLHTNCHHQIVFANLKNLVWVPSVIVPSDINVSSGTINMLMNNWSLMKSKLFIGRNHLKVKMSTVRFFYLVK